MGQAGGCPLWVSFGVLDPTLPSESLSTPLPSLHIQPKAVTMMSPTSPQWCHPFRKVTCLTPVQVGALRFRG